MRIPVGPEFEEERGRYAFRFCCEDCAYFDRDTDGCAHGWPTEEHRLARYDGRVPEEFRSSRLRRSDGSMRPPEFRSSRLRRSGMKLPELVFCKEFELR